MREQSRTEVARVFEAADAILDAMEAGPGAGVAMSLNAGPGVRVPPGAFTQCELVEAMTFLLRMGFTRSDRARAE